MGPKKPEAKDPDLKDQLEATILELQDIAEDIEETYKSALLAREAVGDTRNINMFKARMSMLHSAMSKFNCLTIQAKKLKLDLEQDPGDINNLQRKIKQFFYESLSVEQEQVGESLANQSQRSLDASTTRDGQSSFKLPTINLPTFDGDMKTWPGFKDTYVSLIHQNIGLTSIQKFHYLKSALKGPALQTIALVPLSAQSYDHAWTTLRKRYDNKRIQGINHLTRLFNYKPMQRATLSSLQQMTEVVFESVAAFRNLKLEDEAGFVLLTYILRLLTPHMRDKFDSTLADTNEVPKLSDLNDFIHRQYLHLQAESCALPASSTPSYRAIHMESKRILHVQESYKSKLVCPLCRDAHLLFKCPGFVQQTPEQRFNFVKKRGNMCFNCLSDRHTTKECKSRNVCHRCSCRHHTLIHLSTPKPGGSGAPSFEHAAVKTGCSISSTSLVSPVKTQEDETAKNVVLSSAATKVNVLLGTAQANLLDDYGIQHRIRLVIDCGSQKSFLTSGIAERLRLKLKPNPHQLCGFGDVPIEGSRFQTRCHITPLATSTPVLTTEAILVPRISSEIPACAISDDIKRTYQNFQLADEQFDEPGPVDFLLGADLFPQILSGKQSETQENCPTAIDTIFGWVIMGPVDTQLYGKAVTLMATQAPLTPLNAIMERFWEVEEVNAAIVGDPLDAQCESHFSQSHSRSTEGRYMVRLPFRTTPADLTQSRIQAAQRFYSLERNLDKNATLRQQYSGIIQEYLQRGYCTISNAPGAFYLPHHPVLKDSLSTRVRIVFDASATTVFGSLNDHLLVGPKLHKEIRDVLLGFQMHPIAIVADICQMYLQIEVHPEDRKYLRFLWREEKQDALQDLELNRVPFGLRCSPFLALRVLHQLVLDEGSTFPRASQAISEEIYVDDVLSGAETLDEACKLQDELISLLGKGGFLLKKWSSNYQTLLQRVSNSEVKPVSLCDVENSGVKLLGLQWEPQNDCLSFKVQSRDLVSTKRGIMSTIARIYDPLGYLAPVTFFAKKILQKLWQQQLDWDEEVPSETLKIWTAFYLDLPTIQSIRIDRFLQITQTSIIDVMGFADASMEGYAAVVYIRVENLNGAVSTKLLLAKTKLSPLKSQSIPRLELCAMLLLTRTMTALNGFLSKITIRHTYLLSDSTNALFWINKPPNKLKTFVANRVSEIQSLTSIESWYHVGSEDNGADVASRGEMPTALYKDQGWWEGPPWLRLSPSEWPLQKVKDVVPATGAIELKSMNALLTADSGQSALQTLIEKTSNYSRLLRITAYVKRFVQSCKSIERRSYNERLNISELRDAETTLILFVQSSAFGAALKSKHLNALTPYKDNLGIIRVGGRLRNAPITDDAKHPMLLPKKHKFIERLVDHVHVVHLHAGPQLLNALLRQRYWIIAARSIIRARVHACLRCHRLRAKGYTPQMSDLPASRFEQGRPFINVGVDFAGPMWLRESLRRKAQISKAYICVFVCLSTKAVHIDVVSKLTSEAFLACFDRFIARRGKPANVLSDNGTNFIGANRRLRELGAWWAAQQTKDACLDLSAERDIRWTFIPPASPHFGGLWEAGVKSIKSHLIHVAGSQPMTFEELTTITCRIESILNSRPLYPLSSSPDTYDVLTPGHFLIGAPLVARIEDTSLDGPSHLLTRWRLVEQSIQQIWRKWRTDYLHNLQQRTKWKEPTPGVPLGTLVVFIDKTSPPLQWKVGRIIACFPGTDGIVRMVKVKTSQGEYVRAITQLAPLLPSV